MEVEEVPGPPIPMSAGDMVLLPHGHAHILRDSDSTPVRSIESLEAGGYCDTGILRYGGGGAETHLVCGTFFFQDGATNPLLRSLPPVLMVRGEMGRAVEWLEGTLAFLTCEASHDRPGAATVLARLSDILFIQAIRAYLTQMPPEEQGWLRAMTDPEIAPALQAFHRAPAEEWTVETLARRACLSRSVFAARFTERMGEPPLQYMTRWRMHLAVRMLGQSDRTLAEIAVRVGYGSEAAFSKTFKRWTGVAPGMYRRRSDLSALPRQENLLPRSRPGRPPLTPDR
jgi:AraC family transcriptional regulator, alkane utilization regulator